MTKKLIIISLVFLISVIYSTNVFSYYRDQYWECSRLEEQSQGDFWGRLPQSSLFNSNGICQKSCCILCVSSSPFTNCFSAAAKPMCSCSDGAPTDTNPPVLTLSLPIQNNVYQLRAVEFNLASNERAKIEYIDNKNVAKGYKLLCRECTSFIRKVNFVDGANDITIRAMDAAGNVDQERIKFIVDSKKPSISSTEPKTGKYGNGDFLVTYSEDNLEQVSLFYRTGASTTYNIVSTNDCEEGSRKTCNLFVNNLDNQELFYYFEIKDIVGRTIKSREQKITIDTINPILTLNNLNSQSFLRRLPLSLIVSEKVDIEFKDLNGDGRFRALCKNCNTYNRELSFRNGIHNLIVKATDKAGNTDEKNFVFSIQS